MLLWNKEVPLTLIVFIEPTCTKPLFQCAGLYLLSCFTSKPIVQLKELFQYIAGSQWTSHQRSAIPHVKAASSPAPTYSVPSRHKARCISACLFLSALVAPLSRGALWLTLACQAACVECRLASQCSHHGGIHGLYLWRSWLTISLLVNSRVSATITSITEMLNTKEKTDRHHDWCKQHTP